MSDPDTRIKPLLLLYVCGSTLGTGLLVSLTRDASRAMVLATTLHLVPESLLWSNLLFPLPLASKPDTGRVGRLCVMTLYAVGAAILFSCPLVNVGSSVYPRWIIGQTGYITYISMACISDNVCLYLGLIYVLRRTDTAIRRVGVSLLVHGFGFNIAMYEGVLSSTDVAFHESVLKGWGWFLLVLVSAYAFNLLVPLFKEKVETRTQQPTTGEKFAIAAGIVLSNLVVPALAGVTPRIDQTPTFLPEGQVLVVYRVVSSLSGLMLFANTLNEYVLAKLPLLPA